ncbi:MAG: pilus assembly protein [Candidatus Aureabacteria bacterium]|nr:pilus assembly protein [Candidatus Auribacterota bacterium]
MKSVKHTSVICDHPRSSHYNLRSQKGNAMTEFVFVMPILGIIFMVMFQLYLIVNAKHKVIEGARYAAWEAVYRPGDTGAISQEIKNTFFNDPANTSVTISRGSCVSRTSARSAELGPLTQIIGGSGYYCDSLFSNALFARFGGFGMGLARPLEIRGNEKVMVKVEYNKELEYIDIINELGSLIGGDKMTIPHIKLSNASVVLYGDWSASNRGEFARRVGVPAGKSNLFDFSFAVKGLWLYPIGSQIGSLFRGLQIVYRVGYTLMSKLAALGRAVGIEVEYEEPIDPRGRYFRTDNPPDIPVQQQQLPWWMRWR